MEDTNIQEILLAKLYVEDRLTGTKMITLRYRSISGRGALFVDGSLFPVKYTLQLSHADGFEEAGKEKVEEFPYAEEFPCEGLFRLLLSGETLEFKYNDQTHAWQTQAREQKTSQVGGILANASFRWWLSLDLARCLGEFTESEYTEPAE